MLPSTSCSTSCSKPGFHTCYAKCNAESEAKGEGRQKAEQGQWYRLHGHSKTGHDAAIVRLATALLDADVRRSMYKHPWLSHDKYRGKHCTECIPACNPDYQQLTSLLPPAPLPFPSSRLSSLRCVCCLHRESWAFGVQNGDLIAACLWRCILSASSLPAWIGCMQQLWLLSCAQRSM